MCVCSEWSIINKTLEAADKAHPPPPPPAPTPPAKMAAPHVPKPTHRILTSAPNVAPSPARPSPVRLSVPPTHATVEPPTASSSRPMIKLKVGSNVKPTTDKAAPPTVKPMKRKPKPDSPPVLDAPPPPYIDDGSHDILQEVLAIEREQNERHRNPERSIAQATSNKRKKLGALDEEEILELASPAKKERPSPSGPSLNAKSHKNSPAPLPAPAPIPKPLDQPSKPKKEKPVEPAKPMVVDTPPLPSLKGKEKETSVPAQQNKPRKATQTTPINVKKCKDLMKVLLKLPESAIFLRPVDVVLDGCPT